MKRFIFCLSTCLFSFFGVEAMAQSQDADKTTCYLFENNKLIHQQKCYVHYDMGAGAEEYNFKIRKKAYTIQNATNQIYDAKTDTFAPPPQSSFYMTKNTHKKFQVLLGDEFPKQYQGTQVLHCDTFGKKKSTVACFEAVASVDGIGF